jgi:outer membrane protein assembly factor BamB
MRRRVPLFCLILLMLATLASPAGADSAAWTTYRHDAARTGIDPDSTSPVTPAPAWQTPALDGEVYAQPLVYGSRVYVATENDTIYALDAATGAVVWSSHLATPEAASAAPCGDIDPTIGITGTPVIDPATARIYAVGAVDSGGTIQHELFALDLGTGQSVAGFPLAVDPPFAGGSGGAPVEQLQRPGLALDSGRILIGYGGNDGDCATYWGWVVSAPETGGGPLSVFQVDPSHQEGAIWAAGNAPPVDAAGDAYVATGNGAGNSTSNPDYGDSVVKLDASASVLDWWAPSNWQSLDSGDADLGSSMPALLPGGYLFQAGKDGNGYLLNGGALGHVSGPVDEVSGFCSGGSFGGAVYDPVDTTIYVACGGGLRAVKFTAGAPPSIDPAAGFSAPSAATGPPMIAAGLVWVASWSKGTLYGIDPASGTTRAQFPVPEQTATGGSDVNHFATASAGGGRLFLASGDQVTALTIAQPPPPSPPPTGGSGPPVVTPPPAPLVLSHVSLRPRRVRRGHAVRLRLTLSSAATVTVTVSTRRHAHRVLRHRYRAHRGRNGFVLGVGRLRAGRYTVAVQATARRRSRTVRLRLSIIPR